MMAPYYGRTMPASAEPKIYGDINVSNSINFMMDAMAEWSKATDLNDWRVQHVELLSISVIFGCAGSNPARVVILHLFAL